MKWVAELQSEIPPLTPFHCCSLGLVGAEEKAGSLEFKIIYKVIEDHERQFGFK